MNISSSAQYLSLALLRGTYRYTLAIGNLTQNAILQFQPAGADWYDVIGTAMPAAGVTSGVTEFTALNCPMRLAFAGAPASPYHVHAVHAVHPNN